MLFSSKPVFRPNAKPHEQLGTSRCSLVFAGLLGVSGALLIAVGAVVLVYYPSIVQHAVQKEIPLVEGARSYNLWQSPPVPLHIYFYFFNVTNHEDYKKKNAKPILQEVGPYVYSEKWVKGNFTWHPNGTVTYSQTKTYFFEREMSSGSDTDRIYTVNVPMLTAANMFKNAGPVLKVVLTTVFTMTQETLLINVQIKELLWDGYDDAIMKVFKEIMPNAPYPYEKFAFFYARNGSGDGMFTVNTGVKSLQNFTIIDNWNGKTKLDFWHGAECNMINGTVGETFPPQVDTSKPLRFFVTDFCRSLFLEYSEPVQHNGIDGVRFEATEALFANATLNPSNECFCEGSCLPSGVYNISACKWGAPIAISLPHFLMADPRYLTQVEGLKPDKDLHQMFIDIEPTTGFVMDIAVRAQINGIMERIPNIVNFDNVNNTVFPIFWFTQTAGSTPEIVDLLTLATKTAYVYGKLIYYSLFVVGIVLVMAGVVYYIILTRRQQFKG